MSRDAAFEGTLTNLVDHPAAKAWYELGSDLIEPEAIVALKEHDKSAVYRLEGVGPAGGCIIGKRCKRGAAMVERVIYEEILPYLPIPALHYYGFIEESEGEFCWLFLEDAHGDEFSPCLEAHRTLAARWVATMHISAADIVDPEWLPDRGPAYYLRQLQLTSNIFRQNFNNPRLNRDQITVLRTILSRYEFLESRWGEINSLSDSVPRTLVHGDFVAKNMFIRKDKTGSALLAFDWENAGYGVIFVDLAQSPPASTQFSANPDIGAYWAVVRNYWPDIKTHDLERLANFGTLLRLLEAINWITERLSLEWIDKPVSTIAVYECWLAELIQTLGLGK
jgi:hypothetical protein